MNSSNCYDETVVARSSSHFGYKGRHPIRKTNHWWDCFTIEMVSSRQQD